MNTNHELARTKKTPCRFILPPVDIRENESEVQLEADMPGVTRDSLELQVENGVLRIAGEIPWESSENSRTLLQEVPSTRYARSFTLSRELDSERIHAEIRDGVLRLTIPKSDASKPRRIEVNLA